VEPVEVLIKAGAAVDAQDNKGSTPLLGAARVGGRIPVRRLLSAGASLSTKDKNGTTPREFIEQMGLESELIVAPSVKPLD
jgi:ankyrin repeat protein